MASDKNKVKTSIFKTGKKESSKEAPKGKRQIAKEIAKNKRQMTNEVPKNKFRKTPKPQTQNA